MLLLGTSAWQHARAPRREREPRCRATKVAPPPPRVPRPPRARPPPRPPRSRSPTRAPPDHPQQQQQHQHRRPAQPTGVKQAHILWGTRCSYRASQPSAHYHHSKPSFPCDSLVTSTAPYTSCDECQGGAQAEWCPSQVLPGLVVPGQSRLAWWWPIGPYSLGRAWRLRVACESQRSGRGKGTGPASTTTTV